MKRDFFNTLVFESSPLLSEGISAAIHQLDVAVKNHRVSSINEFSDIIKQYEFHIAFVNPVMIQNRLQFWKKIKRIYPNTRWFAFTTHILEPKIVGFYDQVFSLYASFDELKEAFLDSKQSHIEPHAGVDTDALSEREIEVLTLLINGCTNKEIADKLHLSVHTVISHRKNIVVKTGIKSQSGLTIYAISNNIVSLEEFS